MSTRISEVYPMANANQDKRLRAYSVEKALEFTGVGDSADQLIDSASEIESYIRDGLVKTPEDLNEVFDFYRRFRDEVLNGRVEVTREEAAVMNTLDEVARVMDEVEASVEEGDGEWKVRTYGAAEPADEELPTYESDRAELKKDLPPMPSLPDAVLNVVAEAFTNWLFADPKNVENAKNPTNKENNND